MTYQQLLEKLNEVGVGTRQFQTHKNGTEYTIFQNITGQGGVYYTWRYFYMSQMLKTPVSISSPKLNRYGIENFMTVNELNKENIEWVQL